MLLGVLRPGGAYVAKVLAGGADNQLVAEMKPPLFEREARQAAAEEAARIRASGTWWRRGFRLARQPFLRASAIAFLSAS